MYAPGAATGWCPQQTPTTQSPSITSNKVQGNSIPNSSQAASADWTGYSKQYAQYTQWWNQQQAQSNSSQVFQNLVYFLDDNVDNVALQIAKIIYSIHHFTDIGSSTSNWSTGRS